MSKRNTEPGLYYVRVRGPEDAEPRTLYVDGPNLEAIIAALGGRFEDGGPVVWGGRVLDYERQHREPDMTVVPIPISPI